MGRLLGQQVLDYWSLSDDEKLRVLQGILDCPSAEGSYGLIVLYKLGPDVLSLAKRKEDTALTCGDSRIWAFKGPWLTGCAFHDECYLDKFSKQLSRKKVDRKFRDVELFVATKLNLSRTKVLAMYAVVRLVGGFYW